MHLATVGLHSRTSVRKCTLQHIFLSILFCLLIFFHNASSSCLTQNSLLDHRFKLVELLITGPPGNSTGGLETRNKSFIVFDLNGVLCHTKHIPKVPTCPFRHPDERDYDGKLDTLINCKVVHARPGLWDFLRKVLNFAYVVVWSFMVMENTEPIINFLFRDLPRPCLVFGQGLCNELLNKKSLSVPKFGGRGGGQQFLKVLRSRLWRGVPPLEGVPHGWWPTPENTLLIENNPTKRVFVAHLHIK